MDKLLAPDLWSFNPTQSPYFCNIKLALFFFARSTCIKKINSGPGKHMHPQTSPARSQWDEWGQGPTAPRVVRALTECSSESEVCEAMMGLKLVGERGPSFFLMARI